MKTKYIKVAVSDETDIVYTKDYILKINLDSIAETGKPYWMHNVEKVTLKKKGVIQAGSTIIAYFKKNSNADDLDVPKFYPHKSYHEAELVEGFNVVKHPNKRCNTIFIQNDSKQNIARVEFEECTSQEDIDKLVSLIQKLKSDE